MTGETYTNTFGGENVSPANLSYIVYTISTPLELVWAFEAAPGDNVTADKIDVHCTVAGTTVAMPPANRVTVGQDVLFGSTGSETFAVTDNGGNLICAVESGVEWFIWLADNSTENGVWRAVLFGASGSAADPVALAGAGLRANVTKLDQHLPATLLSASYTVLDSDRATVLENTGGGVTYLFPDARAVGNGWFVYIVNAGSGSIILTPPGTETIDSAVNKTIAPGESLAVLSDGGNYHSLGYGRQIDNSITATAIPVGGAAGTTVLSSTQVGAQIQDYSGVLTGNRRIEYGAVVGYWLIYNNTTGAFTLTLAGGPADPGVVVAQGSYSIIRSNGFNGPHGMSVAFTATSGTVTSVATTADLTGGSPTPITTTGTIGLSSMAGLTSGTYGALGPPTTMPSLLVDVKGRITAASRLTLGTSVTKDYSTAVGLLDAGKIAILDAGGNVPSINGGFQPGDVVYSIAASKPGFVFANGTTIGSVGSGASQRAQLDCANLFAVLWAMPAAQAPIFTSAGAASTRGASAAADFTALKRITVVDLRGTVIAGMDNAGGASSANRISSYVGSTTMGAFGGSQSASVTVPLSGVGVSAAPAGFGGNWWAQGGGIGGYATGAIKMDDASGLNPGDDAFLHNITTSGGGQATQSHRHYASITTSGDGTGYNILSFTQAYMTGLIYTNADGSSQRATSDAGNNVQPTMVMNPFIKL